MNYRHLYHAGNFADLMKHSVLVCLLRALSRKARPWCYFDTHAGAGSYDLAAKDSLKTGEAAAGVGRLWPLQDVAPEPVAGLCRIVSAFNPNGTALPRRYPGSPAVAMALAREHDRLVCAEQQPEQATQLRRLFQKEARVAVHARDGYEMIRALVPPPERRGLVLMDPPFERSDEFDALADACLAAHTRWPEGVYALWYPLKEDAPVARFHRRLRQSGMKPVLRAELRLGPATAATLMGSGMVIVNPPWQSERDIAAGLAFLAQTLAPGQASHAVSWLVPE